ncbi:hypothetical protein BpHYR1_053384 [Brachionus plicatilis]|uniref:Uncharacterized protein n=1 Tax=Brachionus plicatilis TaxID=10195 RepID=A0A3M7SL43_BRAPC|nr:hypothetical protein BpHYR1_053384 [Brachionus plicatilis]
MEFLNTQKTLGLFNDFKYNIHKKNENGTIRWRCESCKSMSVTTNLGGVKMVGSKKSGEKISEEFSIIQKWGFFNFTVSMVVIQWKVI